MALRSRQAGKHFQETHQRQIGRSGAVHALLDANSVKFGTGAIALHDANNIPLSSLGAGNIIALCSGLAAQVINSAGTASLTELVQQYFFGNPAASCLTLSMIVFIASGEAYHRSSRATGTDARRLNRIGDGLSGMAAIILTFALVGFGTTLLALVAGVMLALGKFGTAFIPENARSDTKKAAISRSFRLLVVLSRFPSLFALAVPIADFYRGYGNTSDTLTAAIMFGCYLLWLWADCLLIVRKNR